MTHEALRIISWGGVGDALLLTPALRALKRENPRRAIYVYYPKKSHEEVLRHNPNIDALKKASPLANPLAAVSYYLNLKPFHLVNYGQYGPSRFSRRHAAELIGGMLGIAVQDRRMEVFLAEDERRAAADLVSSAAPLVALHAGPHCSPNKQWPLDNWRDLVRRNPTMKFVQLGLSSESRIEGALDLRGRTSLREALAIIERATCFIGIESSLAHGAEAVGVPGVVLFGPSAPDTWGSRDHINLYKRERCSPCIDVLLAEPCPYGAPCMSAITVAMAESALRRLVEAGTPRLSAPPR